VRKQLFIALALLTFICPGLRTASAQPSARPDAPVFKEVTKEKFKELYFRLGGGKASGWTAEYWQEFLRTRSSRAGNLWSKNRGVPSIPG
jgi:hypothetical protein